MPRELVDLAGVLARLEVALDDPRPVVSALAYNYKAALLDAAKAAAGGDLVLGHMGKRGAKIAVRYNLDAGGSAATILGPPPWGILEQGAKPHEIRRKGRRRKKGRQRALAFGGRYAATVHHPGMRAPHAWTKGLAAGQAPAVEAAAKALREALERAVR